jgi:prepilin-type processing-associated H-X9-DG protein
LCVPVPSGTYEARHTDGANFAYCDGHVKWQQLSELLKMNANGIYPVFTIEEDWQRQAGRRCQRSGSRLLTLARRSGILRT